MVSFELTMQPREHLGKSASRRLRRLEKKVPVVLYGAGKPSVALSVDHSVLSRLTEEDAFYSSILTIKSENETYRAIIKALTHDPIKPTILHADFLRVEENKAIELSVPLHFVGEQVAPGVKLAGGVISYQITSIDLRCLPKNIPETITVDLSKLEADQHIMLSQIDLPEGVSLGYREDRVVVTILGPRGQSTTSTETTAASE